MKKKLSQLLEKCGGKLARGDKNLELSGYNNLKDAQTGEISFFRVGALGGNAKYRRDLRQSCASAIIVDELSNDIPVDCAIIISEKPSQAFSKIVSFFIGEDVDDLEYGVHSTAIIDSSVNLPTKIGVGAGAVIAKGAEIGEASIIGAGVFIGKKVKIGARTKIYSNVSVYSRCEIGNDCVIHSGVVVGADGFGFEQEEGKNVKVPHYGIVRIGDCVELGACTTIDRARFGETVLEDGCVLDNHVQIGHNVKVGKNCVFAAHTGVAGSTTFGDNCIVAAQVGIIGHVHIGSGSVIMAKSGVTNSLKPGELVWGLPARDSSLVKKAYVALLKLPELLRRVSALEKEKLRISKAKKV